MLAQWSIKTQQTTTRVVLRDIFILSAVHKIKGGGLINPFTWGLNWFKKLQFDVNVFL